MKKIKKKNTKKTTNKAIDHRIEPILLVLDEAMLLLADESKELEAGDPLAVENYFELKKDCEIKIKKTTRDVVDSGFTIVPGSPEANIIELKLIELHNVSMHNAASLQGVKDALDHIGGVMKVASASHGSEGMYNRVARKVVARDQKMIGFESSV